MRSSGDSGRDTVLQDVGELYGAGDDGYLLAAAQLIEADTEESELRALVAAREHLGMDVSYCSHLTATAQIVQRTYGDAGSFGLASGQTIPLGKTYCERVVDGRLPNLIADTRRDERTADLAPALGAYIGVPVTFSDGRLYGTLCCANRAPASWLRDRDVAFMRILGRMLAHELECDEVQRAAQRHRNEAIALGALFAALDARDHYTGSHTAEVVELAVGVGRALGMPDSTVDEVKQVALLHDIGKVGISDAILAKPGPLDDDEWKIMHSHPVIGAQIVASIDSLAPLAPAVRAEHERYDGLGYPDGLAREQIPLASRITFACDAYHAMISARPYRTVSMLPAEAATELQANAGTQFDPDVVTALLHVLHR